MGGTGLGLAIVHLDTAEMKDKQGAYYVSHYEGSSIHDSLLKIYAMRWTELRCV